MPSSARFKLELMFHGIRYSEALGQAAEHAFPNFYPYHFQPGEYDPTGTGWSVTSIVLSEMEG